ncbi:hypothetical protein [Rodentibacter trehalosifermentans]|uniref:hypothetical protein n=1 Tax=Rodentibacter trehalosifermentans TaxID=1908263 RepID=UPI000987A57C|nr:hypothetical protein [Rodentibacter trehalosifermentans]OOF53124.1 hypothetical protein BKK53_02190 [Rodentibacter trehalosifermentans]
MFKEKGYDEFLAEKIRRGKEDIAAGRVVSLDEARNRWQQTIERKAAEFAQIDESHQEVVYG